MKNAVKALRLLKIITTLILVISLSACKKELFNPELTKEFKLVSDANGATYKIKVALPDDFSSSTGKFATLYVLDSEEDFDFVANKCKEISSLYRTTNVVVVGIGYGKNRSIDYTPTKVSSVTGGASKFLNFIEMQVVPQIEQFYKADTARNSRTILGHSYGGLFGVYAFSTANKLFGNYVLLSPSLWFDNFIVIQFEKEHRNKNKSRQQLIYMGIGDNEDEGRMKNPFKTLCQIFQDNYKNMKLAVNFERNAGHMDSKRLNIIKALNYYFQNR